MGCLNWLTDPHLDFLDSGALDAFVAHVQRQDGDALVISGDIAESHTLFPILQRFDEVLDRPVYFTLGNHDYYGSEIQAMRGRVKAWSQRSTRTKWLPDLGCVSLSTETALVGHSGWGDGGYGDFLASPIRLNDYLKIENLVCANALDLQSRLLALGEEAAEYVEAQLEVALAAHDNVILATHVPPFVEACWYQGFATLNAWTPHFTCKAMGDRLLRIADRHPSKNIRVICGHTHSEGRAEMRDNLVVVTGGAEYGRPALQAPVSYI